MDYASVVSETPPRIFPFVTEWHLKNPLSINTVALFKLSKPNLVWIDKFMLPSPFIVILQNNIWTVIFKLTTIQKILLLENNQNKTARLARLMGILSNDIDPRLQSLYDHWFRVRKGALIPNRRDIDPVAIWTVLPFVWMCDYNAEDGRFRYRLAGEEMNIFHHRNLVGTYLDETLTDNQSEKIIPKYRRAIEQPAIIYVRGAIHAATHPHLRGERLLLPLADTGTQASIILGATVSHFGVSDQGREKPEPCETIEIPLS